MTNANPDKTLDIIDVKDISSQLKSFNEAEDLYLFFAFNGMVTRQLKNEDGDKVESCIRICEYLIDQSDNEWIEESQIKLLEIFCGV